MGLRLRLGLIGAVIAALGMTGTAAAQTETKAFTSQNVTFPDIGNANPYPRTLEVSGVRGLVTQLGLKYDGFSSDRPVDIDTLLVAPDGKTLVPISDAGGATGVAGLDFTFQDGAAPFTAAGPLTSGTFQPTDFDPLEPWNAPAPAPPFGTTLAQFNGINANGTWRLFAFSDFVDGDSDGSLSNFELTITSELPTLTLKAKKQKLKGKVKVTATGNSDGTLSLSGGVKASTAQLKAGVPTVVKAKLKKSVRKSLAAKLARGAKKAKVVVKGSFTDVTATTASSKVKVKVTG